MEELPRVDGGRLKAPSEPGSDARLSTEVLERIAARREADEVPHPESAERKSGA